MPEFVGRRVIEWTCPFCGAARRHEGNFTPDYMCPACGEWAEPKQEEPSEAIQTDE